jgi:hypothetical protein
MNCSSDDIGIYQTSKSDLFCASSAHVAAQVIDLLDELLALSVDESFVWNRPNRVIG